MRMMTFAKRCAKEILRDPINLGFGLGFPLVLLLLLTTMQKNIPVHLFEIDTLAPGITVFGLSFMTLFSATLIAKDRESALLQRLYTTPLTGLYEKVCFRVFTPRIYSLRHGPHHFSDTLSDFATDRCRSYSNRKSGMHWNLFNNRTCFYCRRYERHLSN